MTDTTERTHSTRLTRILDAVRAEAVQGKHQDLVEHLDAATPADRGERIRVVVVGETNRGKSTLVNSLIGRPLLSPVSAEVTTSCWLELSYGERDEAIVLLADPAAPGTPRRVPIDVRDVARYVALTEIADPVLGVEVKLRAPLLRDLVLVDTPGVGGLQEGHAQATLAALGQADAVLFVCDATQPILAPEVAFLAEAAVRVPAVVVAATKRDTNADFEVVVAETRARLAARDELRDAPVFAVSAPLADRATDVEDAGIAARLIELSGMAELVGTLKRQAASGADALRAANAARVAARVCRVLLARAEESAAHALGDADRERELETEIATLAGLLADREWLMSATDRRLADLRDETAGGFTTAVSELRDRFRAEAEHGPANRLDALAPRMIADLTALGVTTLEATEERTARVAAVLLDRLGFGGVARPAPQPAGRRSGPAVPRFSDDAPARAQAGLTVATDVFEKLTKIAGGAAAVVTFLTGPGVLAACLALAAGAGWWRYHSGAEGERRKQLAAWVASAAEEERAGFDRELTERIRRVRTYLDEVLPELITARRRELTRLRGELADLERAGVRARQAAAASLTTLVAVLTGLLRDADELAAELLERKPTP